MTLLKITENRQSRDRVILEGYFNFLDEINLIGWAKCPIKKMRGCLSTTAKLRFHGKIDPQIGFDGMTQDSRFNWIQTLPALVIPVCLGLTLFLGISFLIEQEFVTNETLRRYLTGHPISKITLAMFCIGLAALTLIAGNVAAQFRACNHIRFPGLPKVPPRTATGLGDVLDRPVPSAGQKAAQLNRYLQDYPSRFQGHYLWQRLEKGLLFIQRSNSTRGIEDDLKYQAELDIERQQQRYSLVQILVWATPMLGFLGTVLGISQALGGIQVGPENDFQQMMGGLRSSLYVAFDTTALALTLSIVLMFLQFLVDRFENQLLSLVDETAVYEFAESFPKAADMDPSALAIERMGRVVMASSQELVQRQAEVWQSTIQTAESAWHKRISESQELVSSSLRESFANVVDDLQKAIGKNIRDADESMSNRWGQWQVTLSDNARSMASHQVELMRQSEALSELLKEINESKASYASGPSRQDSQASSKLLQETVQQIAASLSRIERTKTLSGVEPESGVSDRSYVFQGGSNHPVGWKSGARPISVDSFVSQTQKKAV